MALRHANNLLSRLNASTLALGKDLSWTVVNFLSCQMATSHCNELLIILMILSRAVLVTENRFVIAIIFLLPNNELL
jgi:hypothetical protein